MKKNLKPTIEESSLMQALCRYIEAHYEQSLTLEVLAEQAHLSPQHLQRRFKAVIGISPKDYQESCRLQSFKEKLKNQSLVTDAVYEVGFGSPSRIYEKIESHLGMTPKQYRADGEQLEISYADTLTALGRMMIAATDRGICFIQFGESFAQLLELLRKEYPRAKLSSITEPYRKEFDSWMLALNNYLAGLSLRLNLPLDIRGTAFQIKVWKYLQSIPAGSVESYSQVAQGIGQAKSVRAVARACATNRLALAIPCHRVIRGDGGLAGYRWGLDRKKTLLDLEKRYLK